MMHGVIDESAAKIFDRNCQVSGIRDLESCEDRPSWFILLIANPAVPS